VSGSQSGASSSASCIYEGTIRHRRLAPAREFTHDLALAYIDLDELPSLLEGRLTASRPGLLRFRRRDYHGDPDVPLAEAVRDTVDSLTGSRPEGPIRLLTQLRSFGHCFNPVSFYYCIAVDGQRVEAVLAEVTNTPWGERHCYALRAIDEGAPLLEASFRKELHVSPFMAMDHTYDARATVPGPTLSVHIESSRQGVRAFDATLSLSRRELTQASARRLELRYPFASLRVLALIYGQAVGLKLAGAQIHPYPKARAR
jgi:uncharacterized protein